MLKAVGWFCLGVVLTLGLTVGVHRWGGVGEPPLWRALTPWLESEEVVPGTSTPPPAIPSGSQQYGHFPYPEAAPETLMTVASYGTGDYQRFEQLEATAGQALLKMIYGARADGVWMIVVSGFRSVEIQRRIFEDQVAAQGSAIAAARISAPPGYSEHHTGFAVDLAAGIPSHGEDITQDFETTQAFRWLVDHGGEYGFELSFPLDNPQGVSYEPWHWRFVGSPGAAALFAPARTEGNGAPP